MLKTQKTSNEKKAGKHLLNMSIGEERGAHPAAIAQKAVVSPQSLRPLDIMQLQKMVGNQAVTQLMQHAGTVTHNTVQRQANNNGLPDNLKAGVESLSGIDMSDVKVHYNSDKPSGIGALAFTQGTDIHLGPGQERHLPHEAWHVVQQAQGKVQPTIQHKGLSINNDAELEGEADHMGSACLSSPQTSQLKKVPIHSRLIQPKLFLVGEDHSITDIRAEAEQVYCKQKYGGYWRENELVLPDEGIQADPLLLGIIHDYNCFAIEVKEFKKVDFSESSAEEKRQAIIESRDEMAKKITLSLNQLDKYTDDPRVTELYPKLNIKVFKGKMEAILSYLYTIYPDVKFSFEEESDDSGEKIEGKKDVDEHFTDTLDVYIDDINKMMPPRICSLDRENRKIHHKRSEFMYGALKKYWDKMDGVWKVGNSHIQDIIKNLEVSPENIIPEAKFDLEIEAWMTKNCPEETMQQYLKEKDKLVKEYEEYKARNVWKPDKTNL